MCATIGNFKISRLLFADDLVLLSSSESGLQRALNSFADACNTAGTKISTAKTEVLPLSRNPDQCVLPVNGATLKQVEKFMYLDKTRQILFSHSLTIQWQSLKLIRIATGSCQGISRSSRQATSLNVKRIYS